MRTAREMYPEWAETEDKHEYFYGPSDYTPIIEAIGRVAVQVDDRDYQGDTRVLFDHDGKFGFANIGWGSCSGCDALQACDSLKDIDDLAERIADGVKWFDSAADALKWFSEHDWEGDYSWHEDNQKKFVEQVKEYLQGRLA